MAIFEIGGAAYPINLKFLSAKRTHMPLDHAKFDMNCLFVWLFVYCVWQFKELDRTLQIYIDNHIISITS